MAQRLEHRSYKAGVDGSIPSGRTEKMTVIQAFLLFTFKSKADTIYILIFVVSQLGLVAQLVRALR